MTAPKLTSCIYCGVGFDASKSEGDHVIPSAFGKFTGAIVFKRICSKCNNHIGRAEESLLRCGPEALLRTLIGTKPGRQKRGSTPLGAHGKPGPKSVIKHADHDEAVNLVPGKKGLFESPEQFVFTDVESKQHTVLLHPEMNATALRKKLKGNKTSPEKMHFLYCDEQHREMYLALIRTVFPKIKFESMPTLPVGTHPVDVSTTITLGEDYWRAIAKIAFHYFLVNNQRGKKGSEPEFESIRKFIMKGGDRSALFSEATKFRTDFGSKQMGFKLMPMKWGHLLVGEESASEAVVAVSLFLGPEYVPKTFHVLLGKYKSVLVTPKKLFSHLYQYTTGTTDQLIGGTVKDVSYMWRDIR